MLLNFSWKSKKGKAHKSFSKDYQTVFRQNIYWEMISYVYDLTHVHVVPHLVTDSPGVHVAGLVGIAKHCTVPGGGGGVTHFHSQPSTSTVHVSASALAIDQKLIAKKFQFQS